MTTIITKNSSTASAVPLAADLVQGEIAVNVTDKKLYTKNASAAVVELGTTPSSVTTGAVSCTTLATTGNVTLGDASTDTLNVGNGGLVKDASGNVGIGTSSPGNKLSVVGDQKITLTASGTSYPLLLSNDLTTGVVAAAVAFQSAGATKASISAAVYGNDYMTFNVGSNTERMRIDSNGNLLVGTTSNLISSGAGIKALPSGDGANLPVFGVTTSGSTSATTPIQLYSTSAGNYRFYVNGAGTIFATSTTISAISDIRFKENVRELDAGLAEVMALKPRLYDWKEGKGADIKNARGFIAQEFEEVFPDLIDEWKNPAPTGEAPYKSVRQDLIPVLVKAIQELKAELDAAKADIATLKGAA